LSAEPKASLATRADKLVQTRRSADAGKLNLAPLCTTALCA
jgi:hypothetical protein